MSGRCCSAACAVFFKRHVVAIEQTPDGAWRHLEAVGVSDIVDQFGEREVGVLGQSHDLIRVRFKAMGAVIATPRLRPNTASTSLLINPFDCGRGRDAETRIAPLGGSGRRITHLDTSPPSNRRHSIPRIAQGISLIP
jgi:hypothetical protein